MEILLPKTSADSRTTTGRMGRRFSETISIDDRHRMMTRSSVTPERSELRVHRDSLPKPSVLNVEIQDLPLVTEHKQIHLRRHAEAASTQRMELSVPKVAQLRRYSETVATDRSAKYHYELEFQLEPMSSPNKSMAKSGAGFSIKTSQAELQKVEQKVRSHTSGSKNLPPPVASKDGSPPFFMSPMESLKVMDGEGVLFTTVVVGTPAPDVKWLHNGKGVQQNPDFHVTFDGKSGIASLEISDVFPQDTGLYECIAVNEFGMATVSAHLTVDRKSYSSLYLSMYII